MDHAEARALLEGAAVEPDGLERLMAGDTADAAALAGHLAGCDACGAEMVRLRRDALLIRDVVRTTPRPDLRARTLAHVAAVGRQRPASTAADGTIAEAARVASPAQPPSEPASPGADRAAAVRDGVEGQEAGEWRASIARRGGLLAAAAALAVVAFGGGWVAGTSSEQGGTASGPDAVAALERVATAAARLSESPDAESVSLAAADGGAARGALLFSPASGEVVVVATGLAPAPAGAELRCWVETDDGRRPLGRMYFAGSVAYWVGESDELTGLGGEARFGVSLAGSAGDAQDRHPMLVGEL